MCLDAVQTNLAKHLSVNKPLLSVCLSVSRITVCPPLCHLVEFLPEVEEGSELLCPCFSVKLFGTSFSTLKQPQLGDDLIKEEEEEEEEEEEKEEEEEEVYMLLSGYNIHVL